MRTMKMMIILTIVVLFVGCGLFTGRQYEQTDSGLKYKFYEQSEGEMAVLNQTLSMHMTYHVDDSMLFNSHQMGVPTYLQLIDSEYPGDIFEGLGMMAVGDSASFKLNAGDFFLQTAGMMELPYFVDEESKLVFNVRLLASMDEEAFLLEQERIIQELAKQDEIREVEEEDRMMDYLDEEGITIQPTVSGLYYIEQVRGEGAQVNPGDMVAVHYEGRLLDGTVFDSSYQRNEPIEFPVGVGQVIPGWDEGIGLMRVGGSATLVIPSYLAYGEQGAGNIIPPFSTLVFDVELVDIVE